MKTMSTAIRSWLNLEWRRTSKHKDSVAASWAAAHPLARHLFTATTMPAHSAEVPKQQNWWDCGLFVLAYLDYWTFAPPQQGFMSSKGVFQGNQSMVIDNMLVFD